MNLHQVVFGFFVLLAATLNFGFFVGDISNPDVHTLSSGALLANLVSVVLLVVETVTFHRG